MEQINLENKKSNYPHTFKCEICNYSTYAPSLWSIHTNTKKHKDNVSGVEKPPYNCECCNKTFLYPYSWNLHIQSARHKRQGQLVNTICLLCDKKFKNSYEYKKHILVIHSTKEVRATTEFYCNTCDYVFKNKQLLDKHIQGKVHMTRIKAYEALEQMNKSNEKVK